MEAVEDFLGFEVDYRKVVVLLLVIVAVLTGILWSQGLITADTLTGISEDFEQEEKEFREKVKEGKVEPVLTQEIEVTEDGFKPQFSLVKFAAEGEASVRIRNTDDKKRVIVLGDSGVRHLRPGQRVTMTFGKPSAIEIWDKDNPQIRGKIFVERVES